MKNKILTDKLYKTHYLTKDEWITLISTYDNEDFEYIKDIAQKISLNIFGNKIYLRGLIEISNYCKNDCYYCGIRKSNLQVKRYRMSKEEILSCCENAHKSAIKTFVLQGGEDLYFTDEKLCDIITEIKNKYADCAITLSLGERTTESYEKLHKAGADRYLLRHETANCDHYNKLHPDNMLFKNRMDCLKSLKKTGFQTGCGMMIGSPYQTIEHLAEDMIFMSEFKPQMIGIGPFLPAQNTPFENEMQGSFELSLLFISLCRIMLPNTLIPATTALGTIQPGGREAGILHGANVIMPNISPTDNRKNYTLYDNKIGTDDTICDSLDFVLNSLNKINYEVSNYRGDYSERSALND